MNKLLFLTLIALTNGQEMFNNPVLDRDAGDPMSIRIGDSYYFTFTEGFAIKIYKSPILTNFRGAESAIVYFPPDGYGNIWAGEMHLIDGELYYYFCMDGGGKDHRMYVIKADNPNNPLGGWSEWATRLMPEWDWAAIDGTVMKHGNGQLYFVFSTWTEGPLRIHISPMANPMEVTGTPVEIKRPTEEWECHDGCVNEGPFFLYRNGRSFCIFSGSSTWGPDYSLGVMSIPSDRDPMNPASWDMPSGPSFTRNDEEGVFCTGHAAFTVSPDGSETWMMYHATDSSTFIAENRTPRIEKVDWSPEGFPIFPRAHGYFNPQPVPSGQ